MAAKPKNRQHGAKGAAFLKFADKLRESAAATTDPTKADWLHTVADAASATGKEVRKLR